MARAGTRIWPWVLLLIVLLSVVFGYSLPVLIQVFNGQAFSDLHSSAEDGWRLPFLRTMIFAGVTVLLQSFLGFFGGVLLLHVSRWAERFLSVLILPALTGTISVAFIWKLNVMNIGPLSSSIAARPFALTWSLLLGIELWQYAPLFIYMFWLSIRSTRRGLSEFSSLYRLSLGERIRDLYWPNSRNLAAFLILYGIIVGTQEYAKAQLILRASAGTGTELASQRISRFYEYYSAMDPTLATEITLSYSALFLIFCLLTALIIVPLGVWLLSVSARLVCILPQSDRCDFSLLANSFGLILLIALSFPLVVVVRYVRPGMITLTPRLLESVVLTIAALSFVMISGLLFAIVARIIFQRTLAVFSRQSLLLFLGMLIIQFIPPIGVAFCGYYWLSVFLAWISSGPLVSVLWITGQALLTFPIVTSFLQYTHFAVRNSELDFHRSSRATLREIAISSFLGRFTVPYMLASLFGFALIWNEFTFNSVMSGVVRDLPSFALELTQKVDGLGASYFEAVNLIVLSFLPVLAGLLLWQYLARRRQAGLR
jgi:ABC-type sugar transport system permease subunit